MFLILFSYVNIYDSGASSGGTGVFGKKVSKKPRGSEDGREMKMESHHGSLQSLALVLEGLQSPWRRVMVPWWRVVVLLAPGGLRQLCVSSRGVYSSL